MKATSKDIENIERELAKKPNVRTAVNPKRNYGG